MVHHRIGTFQTFQIHHKPLVAKDTGAHLTYFTHLIKDTFHKEICGNMLDWYELIQTSVNFVDVVPFLKG